MLRRTQQKRLFKMKNEYYRFFYRIYILWKKIPGREHAFLAMSAMSFIIGCNLVSLLIIIDKFYDISINHEKSIIIILIAFLFICNYFIFIHKERFIKIEEIFKDEKNINKIISSTMSTLYIILTFALLFVLLFYK